MQFSSRRRPPLRENVVPLINVVFLLLIFFLLTASLRPADVLDVVLPAREDRPELREPADRPVVLLGASGQLALDGRPVRAGELAGVGTRVELRADAGVPSRVLLPLLEALGRAGVEDVEVVTRVR